MTTKFKLVEIRGRAYITDSDRTALKSMLSVNATEAHIKRKRYTIVAGDLTGFKQMAQKAATENDLVGFFAESALKTIEREIKAGRSFYELIVEDTITKYNYHFFA